jgi:hypothetical protein
MKPVMSHCVTTGHPSFINQGRERSGSLWRCGALSSDLAISRVLCMSCATQSSASLPKHYDCIRFACCIVLWTERTEYHGAIMLHLLFAELHCVDSIMCWRFQATQSSCHFTPHILTVSESCTDVHSSGLHLTEAHTPCLCQLAIANAYCASHRSKL